MKRVRILAVFGWLLALLLTACGGAQSPTVANSPATTTKSAANPTTTAPTTSAAANPVVTSTPVVLAAVTPRPTATAAATTTPLPVASVLSTVNTSSITATPVATTAAANLPTPKAVPAGLQGKLSQLGTDFALYVNKLDGKTPQLLLGIAGQKRTPQGDAQILQFPTWSPAGDKIAVISTTVKGGASSNSEVYVVSADGKTSFKVLDNQPNGVIYLSWSPDGKFLTMLVSGQNSLELYLSDTTQNPPLARKVLEGQPLYTGWANDSDNLLIHTINNSGNILARTKAKDPAKQLTSIGFTTPATTPTTSTPPGIGNFRAPAFAPDGSLMVYSVEGATSVDFEKLVIADKDGKEQGRIDTSGLNAAFNWSPVASQLLLAHSVSGRSDDLYDGISLTEVNNGKFTTNKVVNEQVAAFFWSPDGKKLAYVGVNANFTRLTWNIYDLASKKSTKLVDWLPSREQLQVLTYFDQYAQSDLIWSPDSKALVFSGYDELEIQKNGGTSAMPAANVYIAPTEGSDAGSTYLVGSGILAFWSK